MAWKYPPPYPWRGGGGSYSTPYPLSSYTITLTKFLVIKLYYSSHFTFHRIFYKFTLTTPFVINTIRLLWPYSSSLKYFTLTMALVKYHTPLLLNNLLSYSHHTPYHTPCTLLAWYMLIFHTLVSYSLISLAKNSLNISPDAMHNHDDEIFPLVTNSI